MLSKFLFSGTYTSSQFFSFWCTVFADNFVAPILYSASTTITCKRKDGFINTNAFIHIPRLSIKGEYSVCINVKSPGGRLYKYGAFQM